MRDRSEPDAQTVSHERVPPRRGQWLLVAGFIILAALVASLAYWAWAEQARSMRESAEQAREALAELKAGQITAWLDERRGDAEVIRNDRLLGSAVADVISGQADPATEAKVRDRLRATQQQYDYLDVVLVRPDGSIAMRVPRSESHPLGTNVRALVHKAVRTRKVQSSDLYLDDTSQARIEMVSPVLAGPSGEDAVAAVVLHVDPKRFLYPLIQERPFESSTGESLLVERRGDRIVFLNDLRHRKETALKLTAPADAPYLPAAEAVRGVQGLVEGIDYRGVPVLAALRHVPDTPWYIVAKIDTSEVVDPIRQRGWLTAGFTVLIVALGGAGSLLLWRTRESQVNAELVVKEERYRSLYENMTEGVALHELVRDQTGAPADYRIIEVNPAFTAQTELPAETARDALGTTFYGTSEAPFLDRYATAVATGSDSQFESYFAPLDKTFEITVAPQGGDRFATVFEDISKRLRSQEALRESEEKFKYVFDHSMVGKSITLPTGEIQVNDAFCRMLGYSPEELQHRTWQEISHPEDVAATERLVEELRSGAVTDIRFTKRYLKKDGSVVWADVSTAARRDDDGEVLYFITSVLDITERKRAEDEVRRLNAELEERVLDRTAELDAANQELEAFAYSVSHDLRAPLRHISGFSGLLAERAGDELDEKSRHYVDTIAKSVREMGVLIDDLLQFSRTGRTELHIEEVDMDTVVAEALEPVRAATADRPIEWIVGPLPHMVGDHALLRQVWANLLDNAAKYSRGRTPARIEIGTRDGGEECVFYVRDNGVGFDMDYVHKVFGVFQRLHSDEEFEGTGIGLANVQRIITRLGGKVWAEGEVGVGATFSFTLPQRKEIAP